jgi:hypothetical protein
MEADPLAVIPYLSASVQLDHNYHQMMSIVLRLLLVYVVLLTNHQTDFPELSVERDAGFGKLNNVVESGERLYPNTAAEGREVIRQELRQLKLGWESLFDDLSAAQRKLEVALVRC